MHAFHSLVDAILIIVFIYAIALLLRRKGVLKEEHSLTLAVQFGFPELWRQILVLLAAMPPAILGVVFLKRYGGDASLASTLLLVASLASVATLLGVFWFIG